MIINALDECMRGMPQLLHWIDENASTSADVRWIVSSRNMHEIEQQLRLDGSRTRLSLELNPWHVRQAIQAYIKHEVARLVCLNDDEQRRHEVRDTLCRKADGTFLWVALIVKELQHTRPWRVESTLERMPSGLTPLYKQMLERVRYLPPEEAELCRLVISTATIAYRPLHLAELAVLAGLPEDISHNIRHVEQVVDMCGSFLTIQADYVYLIHQSAKDYLMGEGSGVIFASGCPAVHGAMFSRSLQIMSKTLRRDPYDLHYPASLIPATPPESNPLASTRYSCVYWVDHFAEAGGSVHDEDTQDSGCIHSFLKRKYLYWLESLSLLGSMSHGVLSMSKLYSLLQVRQNNIQCQRAL